MSRNEKENVHYKKLNQLILVILVSITHETLGKKGLITALPRINVMDFSRLTTIRTLVILMHFLH